MTLIILFLLFLVYRDDRFCVGRRRRRCLEENTPCRLEKLAWHPLKHLMMQPSKPWM